MSPHASMAVREPCPHVKKVIGVVKHVSEYVPASITGTVAGPLPKIDCDGPEICHS